MSNGINSDMRAKAIELGLTSAEYDRILSQLGREPNLTELGMFAALWSEHCAYKHSRALFSRFPTDGPHILQGPGENAGIIDIGDGMAVVMKVESHNHPSAVEPYQGAATGVGGILRDIFTMGARPVACLNSLRFGPLADDRTCYLFSGVVSGIAGYGNCVGVPTVGGEIQFDESYTGNPLVNVMCVGLARQEDIITASASGVGNAVMVAGAKTGRDGILGASFASGELNEKSEEKRPAIQVGDPFTEKLLIEATLEVIKEKLLVGIQDMGAAGLTSSACEMAARAETGIEMDLLKVPRREEGITSYEMMLSESQERMLLVPKPGYEEAVAAIYRRWGLDCNIVGSVTADGMLRLYERSQMVAEVPAWSLSTKGAPKYVTESAKPAYLEELNSFDLSTVALPTDYDDCLLKLLASPGIASKEWVYRQYDHMIQNNTVLVPGRADAAVLRVKDTAKGIAFSMDGNGRLCYLDPYTGAAAAVAEAARNVACTGAKPVAVTDGLNYGNPEKSDVYWQFARGVDGIADACRELETPVVGGNVSFYNETNGQPIYPTPIIGMLGIINDISKTCDYAFKEAGHSVILLGETREELGASEYLKVCAGLVAGKVPELDLKKEKRLIRLILELIDRKLIASAHDLSEGGLAVAAAECCIAGGIGAVLQLIQSDSAIGAISDPNAIRPDALLFGESQSRILISAPPEAVPAILETAGRYNISAAAIGTVGGSNLQIAASRVYVDVPVREMEQRWKNSIASCMTAQ
ncbi:MAG: phosphoribosylformylglycinamidine synthase subunit PurL [Bacillota bacterium]|jgi:phosphoribosylformylglycinamidine synthase II